MFFGVSRQGRFSIPFAKKLVGLIVVLATAVATTTLGVSVPKPYTFSLPPSRRILPTILFKSLR